MKHITSLAQGLQNTLAKVLPNNWLKERDSLLNLLTQLVWILLSVAVLGVMFGFTTSTLVGTGFIKQSVFVLSVNLALLIWLVIQLYNRQLKIVWSSVHTLGLIFVVVVGLATLFSQYVWGSLVGTTITTVNAITIWSLTVLAFLLSQRSTKEVAYWIKLIVGGTAVLLLFSFTQFLGWHILPMASIKLAAFTPFGTIRSFGLFIGLLLPLCFAVSLKSTGWKYWVGLVLILLTMIFLQATLTSLAWGVVAFATAIWLLIRYVLNKSGEFEGRWVAGLVLVFALIMALWPVRSVISVSLPANVRLTNTLSYTIAADSATSGAKEFAIGSGPSTFAQVFMQKRPLQLNQASLVRGDQSVELWGVRFVQPSNVASLLLVTTGVLGLLALIGLLLWSAIVSWQRAIAEPDNVWQQGMLATLLASGAAMFVQSFSLPIFTLVFALLGLLVVGQKEKLTFALQFRSFTGASLLALIIVFGVVGVAATKTQAERALASHFAVKSLDSRVNGFFEQSVNEAGRAVQLVPNDDIFTRLLVESWLNYAISLSNVEEIDQQRLETAVLASIQAAARAEQLDPTNGRNIAQLAFVFRQVAPFFDDAANLSAVTYLRAEEIEPTNPALPTERARSLIVAAQFAERNAENGEELSEREIESYRQSKISEAEVALAESIALKSDYAPARFLLANIAIQQNQVSAAINELNELQNSNPRDAGLHYQRGILLYSQSDFGAAREAFSAAVSAQPNFANARYFLGLSLSELGDSTGAIAQFEEIKQLDSDSTEAIDQILANLRAGRDALTNVESQPEDSLEQPLDSSESNN